MVSASVLDSRLLLELLLWLLLTMDYNLYYEINPLLPQVTFGQYFTTAIEKQTRTTHFFSLGWWQGWQWVFIFIFLELSKLAYSYGGVFLAHSCGLQWLSQAPVLSGILIETWAFIQERYSHWLFNACGALNVPPPPPRPLAPVFEPLVLS